MSLRGGADRSPGEMATTTAHQDRSPQFDTTSAHLARRRRNLLLPILLLAAISLLAVAAVFYWSAGSLNQREAESQQALVKSMIDLRRDSLRQLVIDYAWWDEAIVSYGVALDERWAKEGLGDYLRSTFLVAAGWVVSPQGEIKLAVDRGQGSNAVEAGHLPAGANELIVAARNADTIDSVPMAEFVVYEQELALAGASLVAPVSGKPAPEPDERNVMVFLQPVDLRVFDGANAGGHIEDLHFVRGPAPPGYLACPITGINGQALGNIVWRDHRPGSDLLWSAAPLLLIALLAVGSLLVLAIRRVDTLVSHEGRLSFSLFQEKQRRTQKSHFVSMVSHELRTPLQAIGTSADMLERFGDQMSRRERQEEVSTIRHAVATLARLVDDVLATGRNEVAQEKNSTAPLDLEEFCQAMWREVSIALRSKQELQLDNDLGGPVCGVNELALHTVLSNLLQNAVKYSRGEGPIKVKLDREGDDYRVIVTDFGPGIADAQREAIFQPYWRAEEVESIAGTGLGLAVARSAAQSMGGDLRLGSTGKMRGPECGTCFVVTWPVSG